MTLEFTQSAALTMGVELELALPEDLVDSRIGNSLEFYFDSSYTKFGYAWIFPKKEGISVGLIDQIQTANKANRLLRFSKNHPIASQKLKGSKEKVMGGTSLHAALLPNGLAQKTYGERFLLVGDAAGFADPITWEGSYFALRISGF